MEGFDFITPIPEDRYNDVLMHLRNNFMPDEPIFKSIKLFERGMPHAEMDAHCLEILSQQLSVMVVDKKSAQIIAVSLNGKTQHGDIQEKTKNFQNLTDKKLVKIFAIIYSLYTSIDLFTIYDVDKILDAHILSVDRNYRGKGLGRGCIEITEKIAKKDGFEIMKAEATGVFSQRVFRSLDWGCLKELKYKDYVDEYGKQIFKPDPPHESVKLLMKPVQ